MIFCLDILLFASAISAAVLQPFQSLNNQVLTTNGSEIILSSNTTINDAETLQLLNTTISVPAELGAVRAQCNARMFGSDLNVASCQEAFANISPDDHYGSFGMRHDGHQYEGILPYQWLSGRYSHDAPIPDRSRILMG